MYGRIEMVGCLGVGKSTLLKACQTQKLESYCIFENLDEIAEEINYWRQKQSERTYFIQTVYYLASHRLIHSTGNLRSSNIVISDFSLLFHHYGYSYVLKEYNLLSNIEYRALEVFLSFLQSDLPNLIGLIYCKASYETILSRIKGRNRAKESEINAEFIFHLTNACNQMLLQVSCPVLELNLESCGLETAANTVVHFAKELTR